LLRAEWAVDHDLVADQGQPRREGVATLNSMPLYLNTRNPNVKSIKDFTEKDRIACRPSKCRCRP
jgi:hypothetical protein